MSTQEDTQLIPPPAAEDEQSLLDKLTAARREYAEDRETFIAIPGYESSGIEVLAHYRLLDGPEVESIVNKVSGSKGRRRRGAGSWQMNLNAALDVMAAACIGIYVQGENDEEPRPLTVNGEPIANYGDPNIKLALGIPESADTTRKVIYQAFSEKDLAITRHSARLQAWFQDTNSNVDDEFLGEG